MALAILVPVIGLSAAGLVILLRAEREAAQGAVRETARAIALAVDRELATAEAALRVLGTSDYLAEGNMVAFHQQALLARTSDKAWIVLFDRDANQIVNTRFPLGTRARRNRPELVTDVMKSQKMAVSDLYIGYLAQKPIITVDFPVPLDGGQRFVLTQAYFPDYFNRTFTERPLPEGWIVGIFDSQGTTIARSHRAEEFVGKPAAAGLLEALRTHREGALRHPSREGIEVYDVFARPQRAGWSVAVGVPVETLEASARRAVTLAALGMIGALAAAVIVAIFLGRRLANAISDTARSAGALGRGQAPVFRPTSIREVDGLQSRLSEVAELLARERHAREQAQDERSRLLQSEQQARRTAEAQNAAKDEFLAMLGHELRNPLSAISGAAAVLQSGTPEACELARAVIARQSGHLARIVDDLLDVSRVMTGKIRLDLQRVDLAEAVRRCAGTMAAAGRTSRHSVTLHTEPAWIDADATRLDQVISNLLINAAKYTPDGGTIALEVRARGEDAVIVVKDTGVGIPATLLPRVFDLFVQGAAALDRGQGGLGVGLALVQRLVTMHGGSVAAASEGPGRGSRFTVRFPRRPAPAAATVEPPRDAARARCRVLLVDDHHDAREMLRMMLELHGNDVSEAADGHAGLTAAATGNHDIAVVDIGLPGMDGYEVARRLRADPANGHMPLIALTGYGQDEDRHAALEAGFDEHLVKPVDEGVLLAAIERLCRRASAA